MIYVKGHLGIQRSRHQLDFVWTELAVVWANFYSFSL